MIYDIYEIYDNIRNRVKKCSCCNVQQSTFESTVGISRYIAAFQLLEGCLGAKRTQITTKHSNSRREFARLSQIYQPETKTTSASAFVINIARIANAVQCHSELSGNKESREFRFSIISASTVKSLL